MQNEKQFCTNSPGGNFVFGSQPVSVIHASVERAFHQMLKCVAAICMIFIVSQSAYGQLTFEQRRDLILDSAIYFPAPITVDPANYSWNGKEGLYYAMARFERGVDVQTAINTVNMANDNPGNAAMFFLIANIDCYLRYNSQMPQATKDKVKNKMTSYPFNIAGTENHKLMYAASGYLTAQTWPEWANANTVRNNTKAYLESYFNTTAKQGYYEFDSPSYFAHHLIPILAIAEFATDAVLKAKAEMVLEWYLTNAAAEWMDGYWVSSSSRTYAPMLTPYHGAESPLLLWLYFGGEAPRFALNYNYYIKLMLWSIPSAVASYRIPSILGRIATDRSQPFTHRESHTPYPGSARKMNYINKTYGMASQYDGNGTLGWSEQMTRWAVRWKAPTSAAFLMHTPIPNKTTENNRFQGTTKYEQVLQYNGTLLSVINFFDAGQLNYIQGPV